MSDSLLQELQKATDPAEKAALIAEVTLSNLPPTTALVARRGLILAWFDQEVVKALLPDGDQDEAEAVYNQLAGLTFIEPTAPGLTFHDLTRTGLITRYAAQQPELLIEGARLAAPVYAGKDDKSLALEGVYCYTLAGDTEAALALLEELIFWAGAREDWPTVLKIFERRDEAEGYGLGPTLPRTAMHHFFKGLAHLELKAYERAIADYDQAIRLQPEDAAAYNNRGTSYAALGQHQRAIEDYDQAIRLQPDYADAFYNTACAYALQGQVEAMLPPLRRALELDPGRYLALIPSNSDFDGVRGDARFQALLAEFEDRGK